VNEHLTIHGAVLFRGFAIGTAQQFESISSIFCDRFSDYGGGNSPRTKVASNVFTSTEYAKDERISMHNEASYLKEMPSRILFFCAKPATQGGQTPIADCRRILSRIDPKVRDRFELKGVLYVNNMHDGAGLGRSWMDVFGTNDRKVVEERLAKDGYEFEWRPGGLLRTSIKAPAILRHPITSEETWINQAEQWHPSSLNPEFRKQLLSIMHEEELPHHAFFGDSSPLEESDLNNIRAAMAAEERVFEWHQGDVLLCDNLLVMHGRQPYSGERKILVAMG